MPSAISTDSDSTYASLSVPANCRKIKATCQQTIDGKLREVVLGQLNCERYDPQTRNVILVSVNGASLPVSNTDLQTALNSIYGQAVSNWQVSADLKQIDIADLSTIDDGDNELCSKYTGDMKTLIQAYKDNIGDLPDENTVCLFICKDAKSGSKQGYMPLKGRFGFLFTKQLTDTATAKRTAAHELAHGTFRLWHTFSEKNKYLFPKQTTDNLMDYNNGSALYQYQWNFVHDPESMWFAWTQAETEGAIVVDSKADVGVGIDCYGRIINNFKWKNSETEYLVANLNDKNRFVITGFSVYNRISNQLVKTISCSDFKDDPDLTITISKSTEATSVYKLLNNGCQFYKYDIPKWSYTNGMDITKEVEKKIVGVKPSIKALFNADQSCFKSFVEKILEKDKSTLCSDEAEINKNYESLKSYVGKTNVAEELTDVINSSCRSAIDKLTFSELSVLFEQLVLSKEIKENREIAVLRLMSCIKTDKYSSFYTFIEATNNELIKILIDEMDDKSIYPFDGNNYTSFIGALVSMFYKNPESYIERFPETGNDELLGSVLNISPKPFKYDFESQPFQPVEGAVQHLGVFRFAGKYDSESGNVTIVQEEQVFVGKAITTNWSPLGYFGGPFSPLTPIAISSTHDLPLVETALKGSELNGHIYIVPAIFLKFKGDKEFNQNVENAGKISLDIITIFASGGTALATKVTWVKRVIAMAEVAGAIADMGITVADVSPEFKETVETFNLAMGLIGVKNLATGGYAISKDLVAKTRALLASNTNVKTLIVASYVRWRVAIASLKKTSSAEEQLIAKQEKVWKLLGIKSFTTAELKALKREELPTFVNENLDNLLSTENRQAIWDLTDECVGCQFKRGDLIEEIFNQWPEKYKSYQNLNEIIPNYKTLDFDGILNDVEEVVSLKTYQPTLATEKTLKGITTKIDSYASKLSSATLASAHAGKTRVLDFTIKKGEWTNFMDEIEKAVIKMEGDYNITIRITEF